jgi:glutathione S-transferase
MEIIMTDFSGATLWITARSPFARRVRLALREHEIAYEEKLVDIFNPPPEVAKFNPLIRVPFIQLKSGVTIIDSNCIIEGFYQTKKDSPLILKNTKDMELSLHFSGLALGLCEGLVSRFIESLRPKEKQDLEFLEDQKKIFMDCLTHFESYIGNKSFIAGNTLSQGDLDMGTALAYFALRYDAKWAEKYPHSHAYFQKLNERTSFKNTLPPPM